jgi:hypothetical protein
MDPAMLNAFAPTKPTSSPPLKASSWRWGVLLLLLLLGGLGLFCVMRCQICAEFPVLALACRSLGIPVEIIGEGLEIRDVTSAVQRTEKGLSVILSGKIVNVTSQPRNLPNIKIWLAPLKKEGDALTSLKNTFLQKDRPSWTHHFSQEKLLPNESLIFETEPHPIQDGEFQIDVRFAGITL